MLSAILAGGTGVSCLDPARVSAILAGYNANYTKVKQELIVTVSGLGTFDIINQLASSNAQLGTALQSAIAGYLTVADTTTITFVNQLADELAAALLTSVNQSGQISSVQNQINFAAADYETFGNAPPGPNYLGPAGDIENDGQSNLAEYTTGAIPKGRELWLADCCITAPLRIVTVSGGGLKVSGISETFAVTVAGGNSNKTFQWRKGSTTSYTVLNSAPSYTIDFLTTASSGNYFCVVSDGTTTRTTPILTLSVTYVPIYFTQQPQGASKQVGRSHTFSVVAQGGAGPGPYQYTWRKGTTTVGANSPSYTISSITAGDAGTYTVRVTSNGGGDTITSQNAVLTVSTGPFSIVTQPASLKVYVGQPASLTVAVSGGSGNYQYTWTKNGQTLTTTPTGTLSAAAVQESDAGTYRCTIRDLNTSTQLTSDNATLAVAQPLTITDQPDGADVSVGQLFNMSVAASGGFQPLSYQWRWEGLNIPGQTLSTYSAVAYSGFAGNFSCVITDASNQSVTSDDAELVVNATVSILQPPVGGDFYTGESTSLTVSATGSGLTYQWLKDGGDIGAPSAPALALNSMNLDDAGEYTVIVSQAGIDPAVSDPAVVRVVPAPTISLQPKSTTLYLGEAHTLSVEAQGGYPPLLYQWRKASTPIDGAISAAYEIPDASTGDQGTYTCVITDQRGTQLTSAAALLFVVQHLSISGPLDEITAYVGDPVSVSVTVTGGAPVVTYAWTRNDLPLGINAPTLSTNAAQTTDSGVYVCTATDARGESVTSDPIVVEVQPDFGIVEGPQDTELYTGETLTLRFVVTGGFPPLTYAWRRGGIPINGATSETLTVPDVDAGDEGNYACSVRDRLNRIISSETVSVEVAQPLEVDISAPQIRQYAGTQVSITANVMSGEGEFHYAWRKDNMPLDAPDAATLVLPAPVSPAASGAYVCLVTDSNGAGALTPACAVDIREALEVVAPPQDDLAAEGGPASFSVATSGGFEPLAYTWFKSLSPVPGGASATLQLENVATDDAGSYYCVITDDLDTSISTSIAHLSVAPALTPGTQAKDTAAYLGNPATLVFTAENGVPPLTYTWYQGDTPAGEGSTLLFQAVSEEDAGNYRCVARDDDGNELESDTVSLQTGAPLEITAQPAPADRYVGESAAISITAAGGIGATTYAWTRGAETVGGNTPALNFPAVSLDDAGLYTCVVGDAISSIESATTGILNVAEPFEATAATQSLEVFEGVTVEAAAIVTKGFAPYTVTWRRGEEIIANGAALRLENVALADAGTYTCTAQDKYTTIELGAVLTLTVTEGLRPQSADIDANGVITLSELLRAIQFYNVGALHCEAGTEDGFAPGPGDTEGCTPHTTDYAPQDWSINLSELLRLIQFYGSLGYYACPDAGTEDGYCPGAAPDAEGEGDTR